ncbi:uncharacterized protein K02A2.6-like [Notechis scutatus]|uniref:Gypsy retrotransposon integrase-like protein 1 n=1 Tax=Notechis scutatus TaxID=8663 RepID=A0A6J1U9N4_9SAUR|nr:uncharacterized protein K02A2.6-like [Notechis scutatus]
MAKGDISLANTLAEATAAEATRKSAARMRQTSAADQPTTTEATPTPEKHPEPGRRATTTTHHGDLDSLSDTKDEEEDIHRLQAERDRRERRGRKSGFQCAGCGGDHPWSECRFLDAICRHCNKRGHITKVCRFKRNHAPRLRDGSPRGRDGTPHRTRDRYTESRWSRDGRNRRLNEARQREETHQTVVIGHSSNGDARKIAFKGRTEILPLTIVDKDRPSLLGLQWFVPLGIEVTGINHVTEADWEEQLAKDFQEVFDGSLGKYRGAPISFSLDPNIAPIHLKPRRVPFALRPKIDEQLDKLIEQGVLEPTDHARWETPIVTPVKPDGSVRICGDYKATLNRALQQSAYPVPVVQHLLHSLGGGKVFAKLDLAQAYQQLPVDVETAEAQTIVTHRGAFRCKRLQFGVSVAPGFFQSLMERLLQGIKGVVPYFDDVLVSATNQKQLESRLRESYRLTHRPGKTISHADALSRTPLPDLDTDPAPTASTLSIETLPNLPVTASDIARETNKDKHLAQVLNWVEKGWPEKDDDEQFRTFRNRQTKLFTQKGCLLWGDRVVVPEKLQKRVLELLHEGHPGIVKTKALARSYAWWPGMDKQIEAWVATCRQCQESRPSPPAAPILEWETPRGPWSRIHIDFAGPTKGHTFLITVDAYSNWLEVSNMRTTTTEAVIKELNRLFSTHGLPDVIVSDNGPQFTALEFEKFLAERGIRHALTAPAHPAANGRAERMVQTTNKSPAELLMGRKLRSPLDRLHLTYDPENPPDSSSKHRTFAPGDTLG